MRRNICLHEASTKNSGKRPETRIVPDVFGRHTICNVYFDTESYELIRASIEKPPYKEKLRLRSYGTLQDDSQVFIELKKKYDGVVYKRRIPVSLSEAEAYLYEGMKPEKQSQIFARLTGLSGFTGQSRRCFWRMTGGHFSERLRKIFA